jgi:bifunctional dethiobiotin synthetase / adenosylmethionine---8-amino-7-oxononanoate aminotransferase
MSQLTVRTVSCIGKVMASRPPSGCFSTALRLSRRHRRGLIFGANTDVGKTVVAAGLTRAAEALNRSTSYVKPLQAGGSDEDFVRRYNSRLSYSKTLFKFETPASPHLASRWEASPVSDADVLDALTHEIERSESEVMWIETAGGVMSPGPSSPMNESHHHAKNDLEWGWVPQSNLYQPFLGLVQVVLVGDGRLGGISSTLSAIESLIIRGYDIAAVVVIDGKVTVEAMQEYLARTLRLRSGSGEPVLPRLVELPKLPPLQEPLVEWFESTHESFCILDQYLDQQWQGQVSDLESLSSIGKDVLWWPFTQHQNIDNVSVIDSSVGDYYSVLEMNDNDEMSRRFLFDACASWWTQGLGHGEPTMGLAAAAAAGRYGHVIFPQVCHSPAVLLAEKLLNGPGRGWARRAFFSDDGSTAIEVAIKMGMKLYQKRAEVLPEQLSAIDWVVCGQEGCYHGDTLGAMNVAEPSIFNQGQHPWYRARGLFLCTPKIAYKDGLLSLTPPDGFEYSFENEHAVAFGALENVFDIQTRTLTSLYAQYKEYIEMQWLVYEHSGVNRIIGAVVLEPIVMGAGGMKMVDPLWQRALMDVAKSRLVPVVFDEVFSGLYRFGVQSCREFLQDDPDIACYAKLLTGGVLPMGVTLASEETFECYLGEEKGQALLHGHSYTANPLGCVAAIQAVDTLDRIHKASDRGLTHFDIDQVRSLSCLPQVDESITFGSVLSVTMKSADGVRGYGASSQTALVANKLRERGIYTRPLGNVIYLMTSPTTSRAECYRLSTLFHEAIESTTV